MRQLLQYLNSGKTELVEVPCPAVKPGHVLVRTRASLVSAGTERMLVEFGKAGLLGKARQQPDRVRQVLDKVRTDGLLPTIEAVRDKLGKPIPLGYCSAGVVIGVGQGVEGFRLGDAVASNGPHAEVVCVPANLCAAIPQAVMQSAGTEEGAFERAAFTVAGAIALQAVRLAAPTLGETFAVIGLGLIGQLAVQILRANGCRVLGVDLDGARVELAERFGAVGVDLSQSVDPVAAALAHTGGLGVDGVLIAAATQSDEPVRQAARMCRKRGRLVLVGVTGLHLSRDDFYQKELTFQVSCSYGPGRYDPQYEQEGRDYPFGFVRWTARRNFEAVLDLMAQGALDVAPLISRRVPLAEAPGLYAELARGAGGIGTVITYPGRAAEMPAVVKLAPVAGPRRGSGPVIGVIGAGSFATRTILPLLARSGARCKVIASRGGTEAAVAGRRFGFEQAASDAAQVLDDEDVNVVFILTSHSSHAGLACDALARGKHVFVEKPLAITAEHLAQVKAAYAEAAGRQGGPPQFHVGFNRRFAPHVCRMKEFLAREPGPKCLMAMVNAGAIDRGHWADDPRVGGGRIVGEACHFVDLLRFLAGAKIEEVKATPRGKAQGQQRADDSVTITVSLADGSTGTVHYWADGSRAYPKERVEVFSGGKVLVLDNFRRLTGYGWPGFRRMRSWWGQDKGHRTEVREFLRRVQEGGPPLIPFDELVEVTEACLLAAGAL